MKLKSVMNVLSVISLGLSFGCAKQNSNSFDSTTADTVGSSIAGASNAADNGGSVVAYNKSSGEKKPFTLALKNFVEDNILLPKAYASSCISSAMVLGASCTGAGNTMTINLNCTGLLNGVWSGTATLTYSSNAACSNASAGGLMAMGTGNSMTLTSSSGITRTALNGFYVTTDSGSSGYAQNFSGGTQVTCSSADCSTSPGRSVNILGVHRILYTPTGVVDFDHTINTTTPLSFTGVGANKVISSGVIQLQHNLAHYIATATVAQPLTFSSNCCHPTGGQVNVVYTSGSRSGTETLVFGPTCGVVTANGNTVSLIHCQ